MFLVRPSERHNVEGEGGKLRCVSSIAIALARVVRSPAPVAASCVGPTQCFVAAGEVRVRTPLAIEQRASIMRWVAAMEKQNQGDRARQILAQYRGVIVEVKNQQQTTLACRPGVTAYPLNRRTTKPPFHSSAMVLRRRCRRAVFAQRRMM